MSVLHDFLIDLRVAFKNHASHQKSTNDFYLFPKPHIMLLILLLFHPHHIGFLSIPCLSLAPWHHRTFEHAISFTWSRLSSMPSELWVLLIIVSHILGAVLRFTAKLSKGYINFHVPPAHTASPLSTSSPEWYVCYNWWAYPKTSLSPEVHSLL